jgi:hypothetical protein
MALKYDIDSIIVRDRHRQDMGDVNELARDIKEIGLLHPVVITPAGVLIAGARRLEACRVLGWTEVPVTVVNLDEIVRGEWSENRYRKDFLPTEIDAIRRAMEPVVKTPEGRPSKNRETFPSKEKGKTSDKIGAFAGVSGRTVAKIATVVKAAKEEPEKFGHLVHEMDRTGKVNPAYQEVRGDPNLQEPDDEQPAPEPKPPEQPPKKPKKPTAGQVRQQYKDAEAAKIKELFEIFRDHLPAAQTCRVLCIFAELRSIKWHNDAEVTEVASATLPDYFEHVGDGGNVGYGEYNIVDPTVAPRKTKRTPATAPARTELARDLFGGTADAAGPAAVGTEGAAS